MKKRRQPIPWPCCVYEIWQQGKPIYVGLSKNPKHRLSNHKSRGVCGKTAQIKEFRWYANIITGRRGEERRIRELRKLYQIKNLFPADTAELRATLAALRPNKWMKAKWTRPSAYKYLGERGVPSGRPQTEQQ